MCVCFLCIICIKKKKCYEPSTIQYYTANGASQVLRLTLLVLRTNWNYKHALRTELIHMKQTYCTVQSLSFSFLKESLSVYL